MLKLFVGAGLAMIMSCSHAAAAVGPYAATCDRGAPSVIARVSGLKTRTGTVRVQIYASNKATFLEKRQWLHRVDIRATPRGSMDICVPVPRAGVYVVSVRHDVNSNGKSDRPDGAGFSGNPKLAITDLVFKRKPNLARVSFTVNGSARVVPIVLNYAQGLQFKPVAGA